MKTFARALRVAVLIGEARTRSALIGAVWQMSDDVAADLSLLGPRVNDHTAYEIRAVITFAFAVR